MDRVRSVSLQLGQALGGLLIFWGLVSALAGLTRPPLDVEPVLCLVAGALLGRWWPGR